MLFAYGSLALAMAIVGAYVGFAKLLVAAFPVFLLAWLRFGIASLAMAHWLARKEHEAPTDARTHRLLFFESLLGNFLFSIFMLYGMRHASAITAGVVMAMIPAAVALLSWLFLREPMRGRTAVAVSLAVAGVAVLAAAREDTWAVETSGLGLLLLLAAVFCEASYVVIGKRLSADVSPKRISAIINLWGLVLMTPFGLWQALDFDFRAVAPELWVGLLIYALAASMWTVWLWMTGLRRVPAARAGVFTVFLPISAASVGVVFFGESFTALHALAFALALAAVLFATWPSLPERDQTKREALLP
ncbi:MAG: DMT family transporter [Casimicrobiaceae bacterium]|nr:DMT family transporter [Casimicrobiaceae bacterium]